MDIKKLQEQAKKKEIKEKEELVIEYFQSIAQKREHFKNAYDLEVETLNKLETKLMEEDYIFYKTEGTTKLDISFNN